MISIIICSRKSDISSTLKENIQNTIGCEYELVVIDNSDNRHSIFTAYNEGVRRAKGEILCFMHDDILYHTNGWGVKINQHLKDPTIEIIGVAGAHFLPNIPMYWSDSPIVTENNLNDYGTHIDHFSNIEYFKGNEIVDVVCIDGMFMCIKKEAFNHLHFDEINYSNFHGYDMDICMQTIARNKRCCICNNILITHSWRPKYHESAKNKPLYNSLKIFQNKWHKLLPIAVGVDLSQDSIHRLNVLCHQSQIRNSVSYKIGKRIVKTLKSIFKYKYKV